MGMFMRMMVIVGTELNKAVQVGKEFGERARRALVIDEADLAGIEMGTEDGESLSGALRAAGYGDPTPANDVIEHPSGEFEIVPEPTEMADPEPLFIGGPTEAPGTDAPAVIEETPVEPATLAPVVRQCGYIIYHMGKPLPPCQRPAEGDAEHCHDCTGFDAALKRQQARRFGHKKPTGAPPPSQTVKLDDLRRHVEEAFNGRVLNEAFPDAIVKEPAQGSYLRPIVVTFETRRVSVTIIDGALKKAYETLQRTMATAAHVTRVRMSAEEAGKRKASRNAPKPEKKAKGKKGGENSEKAQGKSGRNRQHAHAAA